MLRTFVAAPPRDPMRTIDDLLAYRPARPQYRVAGTLEEVTAAWRLVYAVYLRSGFISANRFGVHTAAQALSPEAAVLGEYVDNELVSTLTIMRDGAGGLPLDREYHEELGALRRQGRRLAEIGLFADSRGCSHNVESLLGLISPATQFAFMDGGTDLVIGVHPHHARFYARICGMDLIGPEKTYAAVNDRPVILLRLQRETLDHDLRDLPRGLAFLRRHPVAPEVFARRYDFAVLPATLHSPPALRPAPSPLRTFVRRLHAWITRTPDLLEQAMSLPAEPPDTVLH